MTTTKKKPAAKKRPVSVNTNQKLEPAKRLELPGEAYIVVFKPTGYDKDNGTIAHDSAYVTTMLGLPGHKVTQDYKQPAVYSPHSNNFCFSYGAANTVLLDKEQVSSLVEKQKLGEKGEFQIFKVDLTKPLEVAYTPAKVEFNDND